MMSIAAGTIAVTASMSPSTRTAPSQGRHPHASLAPHRSVLLFAKKKQTSGHRYPRVIATVRLQ